MPEKKAAKSITQIFASAVSLGRDLWTAVKPAWDLVRGVIDIVDMSFGRIVDTFNWINAWVDESILGVFDWVREWTGLELNFLQDWTLSLVESQLDFVEDWVFDQLDPVLEWRNQVEDWLETARNILDPDSSQSLREWLDYVNEFLPDGLPSFLTEARAWVQDLIEHLPEGIQALVQDLAVAFERAEGAEVSVNSVILEPGVLDTGAVGNAPRFEYDLADGITQDPIMPPVPVPYTPEIDLDPEWTAVMSEIEEFDRGDYNEFTETMLHTHWDIAMVN